MSPELETALWIAATGSGILFTALLGLIALMYLLTIQWGASPGKPTTGQAALSPSDEAPVDGEASRRARAAAAAWAVARSERRPVLRIRHAVTNWGTIHRGRRLSQAVPRRSLGR